MHLKYADLKTSLNFCVYLKAIPWKFLQSCKWIFLFEKMCIAQILRRLEKCASLIVLQIIIPWVNNPCTFPYRKTSSWTYSHDSKLALRITNPRTFTHWKIHTCNYWRDIFGLFDILVSFLSPKVVGVIQFSSPHPHQFSNDLSFRILGNREIWTKLGNCIKF